MGHTETIIMKNLKGVFMLWTCNFWGAWALAFLLLSLLTQLLNCNDITIEMRMDTQT